MFVCFSDTLNCTARRLTYTNLHLDIYTIADFKWDALKGVISNHNWYLTAEDLNLHRG